MASQVAYAFTFRAQQVVGRNGGNNRVACTVWVRFLSLEQVQGGKVNLVMTCSRTKTKKSAEGLCPCLLGYRFAHG